MRHLLETEGFGVRLRPVRMDDATFIVWLRNMSHVKGKVGDSAEDVPGQENWLRAYLNAKAIIILLSKHWVDSRWAPMESTMSPAQVLNLDVGSSGRMCQRPFPVRY